MTYEQKATAKALLVECAALEGELEGVCRGLEIVPPSQIGRAADARVALDILLRDEIGEHQQ